MSFVISKKSIISVILMIDFLISIKFFYMFDVPWAAYVQLVLYTLCAMIMGLNRTFCASKRLKRYVGVFLLIILIETFYSVFKYQQDIIDVAKQSMTYLVLIGSFVYFSYFIFYEDLREFIDKLVLLVIIMQLLLLIQAIIYNNGATSIQFLQALFSSDALNESGAVHIRNDMLRCGQFHKYVYLVYFYSLYCITERKKRSFTYVLCVILTFVNEFYVGQTRGSFVIFFVVTVLIVLFALWNTKHEVLFTVIVCVCFLALLGSNILEFLYSTFMVTEDDTISIRGKAIQYFWGLLKQDPIMGIGIIYPVVGGRLDLWHILYGPDLFHKYVYSDIGIIGVIAQYGFWSVFTYIRLYWDMIKTTYKSFLKKDMFLFILGITLYCVGTCATLVIRTVEIPLILAVMAFFFDLDNKIDI